MRKFYAYCFFFLVTNIVLSQEVQVPFDSKGVTMILDKELNDKLQTFSQKNFQEARIYKMTDSTYSLEVITKVNNQFYRERKIISQAQYLDFHSTYDHYLTANKDSVEYPNEGRVKLIASNTLIGLAYYGWAIPMAFDVSDTRTSVGLYMLTGGLSFYLPFMLTRKSNVSYAEATAWYYGQTRGIAHFATLPMLGSENPDYKAVLALGMAGSMLEAFSYYSLTKNYELNNGQVHAINTFADFGLVNGLLFSYYSGLVQDTKYDGYTSSEITPGKHKAIPVCMLAGSALGFGTGYLLTKNGRYSVGDAYNSYGAGLLGAYIAISANNIAQTKNDNVIMGTAAAGTILGLAGGHILSNYTNYTQAQGTMVLLGTGASALFGLGCGYLISVDNPKVWSGISAITGIGGFGLMNYFFYHKERSRNVSLVPSIGPSPMYAYQPGTSQLKMVPGLSVSLKF